LDYILEAARLAPSSSGLQPYKVFVISNKEILEQIRPVAWNQSVITECSHLLVFAAWDGYSLEKITAVFNEMMEVRGLPLNTMDAYKSTFGVCTNHLVKNGMQLTQLNKRIFIWFGDCCCC
jgi:nitroreductase